MPNEIPPPEIRTENQKILVTGAAGFVGNELLKQLLKEGFTVRALFHSSPLSISHPLLEMVQCDILDVVGLEKAMDGITHVYHCAAIVTFDPSDKQRLLKINVEGTANVVNACIDANIKKLVHVSSVAALGRIRKGETITEAMNWTEETNNSTYGKSKYLGELEVWRGIGEGLSAVMVHPTIILGGDKWDTGSAAIFKTAYNEFKWYPEGITGFVDVRDVARAMILLMNSDINAERFILSSENLTYKEIFSEIANCFGKRPPYKKATPFLVELVWRWETIKSILTRRKHLLTKETAHTSITKVYFDNHKILNALPQFEFIKIKETIKRTCAALKDNYHL